jgi:uncharacterized membrane protein
MNDFRLPTIIYVLLLIFGALHFAQIYPQLPERMASHFAADGTPNGWSPKEFFFLLMGFVVAMSAIPTFLVPLKLRNLPPHKINLPNKHYWLAPEHEEDTFRFFRAWMGWFGCALLFVLLFATTQAVNANLPSIGHFDSTAMLYVLLGFGLFVTVWLYAFLRHFKNVPPGQH